MPKRRAYVLKIEAYRPTTFPMNRLAEYIADLATLLGEYESVHFVRLSGGSTRLAYVVDHEAEPKVRERIRLVRSNDAPPEAMRAQRAIDKRLAEDNATGVMVEPGGTRLLEFRGKRRFTQPVYGPFNQAGAVDGIPIRVGGEGDPVPVHLQEPGSEIHICHATRSIARDIGKHLFTTILRAEGTGRWMREKDGKWTLIKFTITGFRELKAVPLAEAVAKLRSIDSGLKGTIDPLGELGKLRHGS